MSGITGHRPLSSEELQLINDVKQVAAACGNCIEALSAVPGIDKRALAIAKTELQTGFMWAVRAIAQPTSF